MSAAKQKRPTVAGPGVRENEHSSNSAHSYLNPAETLLQRLDGARETGPGRWLACCPAHDDRNPSLSIRETSDGTLLIHDFGGCAPGDVLAAIGLELRDLFVDRLPDRPPLRRGQRRVPAQDALAAIDREALVVSVIASDFRQARTIDEETWNRLSTAAARIGAAREAAR